MSCCVPALNVAEHHAQHLTSHSEVHLGRTRVFTKICRQFENDDGSGLWNLAEYRRHAGLIRCKKMGGNERHWAQGAAGFVGGVKPVALQEFHLQAGLSNGEWAEWNEPIGMLSQLPNPQEVANHCMQCKKGREVKWRRRRRQNSKTNYKRYRMIDTNVYK